MIRLSCDRRIWASVDQGKGLIAEHRIKQHTNSNPAISLDRRSSPAK
jgi:hypothetical protein